ncbi:hypothetical protein O3P69_006395 [Scylla paramamosain]|uniref:Cuticle protein n=1 Tax=Scylla paramamosain TaxID=85552 RepID=A0AAW0U273_SCYPA
MWRRRWPTNAAPVFMVMVAVLSSLPVTLTAPTEDSLEDTARVLGHFSAGVGTRRNGAPSRSFTGISQGSLRGQQPFQQLFIPQPAIPPTSSLGAPASRNLGPSLNNPYIIATASSSEEIDEDNPYEDDDDDEDLAMYLSKNLLTVKGDDSSEERLELDDALLGRRYNFIDGQGSHRWGYDLVDQYQHQTVNTDGTMDGRFGWTAPNGQEIRVQYVADDGGYRLVGSSGIHPADSEDVHRLKIEHSQIYKEVASRPPSGSTTCVPWCPIASSVPWCSSVLWISWCPIASSVPCCSSVFCISWCPIASSVSTIFWVSWCSTVCLYLLLMIVVEQLVSPFPHRQELESEGAPFSIPSGQPTGGVPLPSPSGPGAKPSRPGFFDEERSWKRSLFFYPPKTAYWWSSPSQPLLDPEQDHPDQVSPGMMTL